MVRALLYLRLTSLRNALLSRIKRLRQPKYLFGAIAGVAYFWFFFFRHLGAPSPGAAQPAAMAGATATFPFSSNDSSPLVVAVGTLALFAIMLLTWLVPTAKPGLGFTEAETAFLFPAPVSRRMLINFKLLNSQLTILLTSFLFTLISNRWSFLGGNAVTHAVGWWVILSTLNLHFMGAALTLTRLFESGVSAMRRRIIVTGGVALAIVATLAWLWRTAEAPSADDVVNAEAFTHYFLMVLNRGALGVVLWPFRLVLGPFVASDNYTFLLALGPALLLLAAHYFWVMRMNEVSFEEASISMAEKRSARIAQARAGTYRFGAEVAQARPDPFRLGDTGRPEFAFLWKNLLSTRPYFNLRTFAVLAAIIVVGSQWLPSGDIGAMLKTLIVVFSLFAGAYLLLLGPHLARQDLRSDLANSDVLKTYPIRGWRLMLGELLTPVAILSGLVWLAVLAAALVFMSTGNPARSFPPTLLIICAVGVAAIAPPILALELLVLNGATLVFPGWFQSTRGQQHGGIEVMGQRLIFVFANLLVIFAALLPSVCASVIVMGGVYGFRTVLHVFGGSEPAFVTAFSLAAAFVAVLAILVGEVWLGLRWIGGRFEKFDLSAELRP